MSGFKFSSASPAGRPVAVGHLSLMLIASGGALVGAKVECRNGVINSSSARHDVRWNKVVEDGRAVVALRSCHHDTLLGPAEKLPGSSIKVR